MATVKSDEDKLEEFMREAAKRQIDQTAGPKAEPASKRERTREPADEPPAPPAPQREEEEAEDATPISRGVAVAEREIMRQVEEYRADGKTELADAVEATIVTTAPQRDAVLVPMQIPESGGRMNADQLGRYLFGSMAASCRATGHEGGADIFEFLDTDEQRAEHSQRMAEFKKFVLDHQARRLAKLQADYRASSEELRRAWGHT